MTGKRHDLVEVIPPGSTAAALAEAARTRMLNEIDERRNPRTSATLDQLLDRYLSTLGVGRTTHRMYTKYLEKHVRPFIGRQKAGAVDADALDGRSRVISSQSSAGGISPAGVTRSTPGLGVPGATEHAAGHGSQRQDVPGPVAVGLGRQVGQRPAAQEPGGVLQEVRYR